MSIDTGYHPPIKLRPYRTPFAKHPIVGMAVSDMVAANIWYPSKSPWSFLELLYSGCRQKDGTKRFCTDFRKLNISKKSSWPLPVIDDMLTALGESNYFTTLDLKIGYWLIPLNDVDKKKMAFICHRGLYEYNVMAFGLANASGIFQELMSMVLHGLGNFAMAFWMT